MTTKLYYQDQYRTEFSSTIVDIAQYNGKTAIVLEETAFFPEGGGQLSDIGTIEGLNVVDVQIEKGIIYHIVESFDDSVAIADEVNCRVDWKKRFSDMQQHSGEHIFSGIIHNLFGLENLGFHLGSEAVTLDFGRVLTEDELNQVEYLANKAIWENRKINCFFPGEKELESLEYRSKKEITEDLRLVEIEGIDLCACCAPHVKTTGEIGIAKIIGTEKVRGGTRISILCGERAFLNIREKIHENKKVAVLLSDKETNTFAAVSKLKKDKDELASALNYKELELIEMSLESRESADIQLEFSAFEGDALRKYTTLLSKKAKKFAAAFSGDEGNYRFVMIAAEGYDINEALGRIKEHLAIKGGGRNGMIQGSTSATKEEIIACIEKLK